MNCPHCQKDLPDQTLGLCPSCGRALPKMAGAIKTSGILLGRVLLVMFLGAALMAGMLLIVMAVIYAGCVLTSGGRL